MCSRADSIFRIFRPTLRCLQYDAKEGPEAGTYLSWNAWPECKYEPGSSCGSGQSANHASKQTEDAAENRGKKIRSPSLRSDERAESSDAADEYYERYRYKTDHNIHKRKYFLHHGRNFASRCKSVETIFDIKRG